MTSATLRIFALAVREERNEDIAEIRDVHEAAFGRDAEASLVDRLREDGLIVTSVVAAQAERIVANAVFSRLAAESASGLIKAVALAPVAVKPAFQRSGFGSAVVAYGLQICATRGYDLALVLGDPHYYNRFGFSSQAATTVRSPYSGAGAAWMALELRRTRIVGRDITVRYPDAFSLVD